MIFYILQIFSFFPKIALPPAYLRISSNSKDERTAKHSRTVLFEHLKIKPLT